MAARIYLVIAKRPGGGVLRYVRAANLNAAIRAHANELFSARPASAEDVWEASKGGGFSVLDAVNDAEVANGE
jgi:hypothetical protein